MNTNPYESAYIWQNKIIELEQRKQKLDEDIKICKEEYLKAVARGEATGKDQIDGYTCVTERKTTEKRTIKYDTLPAEIVLNHGTLNASFVSQYIPVTYQHQMLRDTNLDTAYKLGLGELDKALGGKKNTVDYVDVEIKEDIKKRITRMAPEPIIEV